MLIKIIKKIYTYYNKRKILLNIRKSKHYKNVLICYITHPFRKRKIITHTNIQESLAIVQVFDELGYNCDLIDHNNTKDINYKKYDIVFGFGKAFEKSFKSESKLKRIYYGTGRHPYFSNSATINRGLNFKNKGGDLITESLRIIEEDYSLQTMASDALIVLGNDDVIQTYKKYTRSPCYKLKTSVIKTYSPNEIIKSKDFLDAKNNFLFFSGGGMVHKGLDILLEFFSNQTKLNLHICAPLSAERRFGKLFDKELRHKNIWNYDFIDLNSATFKMLIKKCAFVILPSCSEGMPTSVLNVIANGGLIPILSRESLIDIDNKSILIKDINRESIEEAIEISQKFSKEEIEKKANELSEIVNLNYTIDCFRKNLKDILILVIK